MNDAHEPTSLERLSAPLLARLIAVPRWAFLVGLLAMVLLGLFLSGPLGGVFLIVVALLLAWLAALGWPQLAPGARLARVAVVLLVGYFAISKFTGWGVK